LSSSAKTHKLLLLQGPTHLPLGKVEFTRKGRTVIKEETNWNAIAG